MKEKMPNWDCSHLPSDLQTEELFAERAIELHNRVSQLPERTAALVMVLKVNGFAVGVSDASQQDQLERSIQ
jgi:hypothetical protein